jgi:hypothetical protein
MSRPTSLPSLRSAGALAGTLLVTLASAAAASAATPRLDAIERPVQVLTGSSAVERVATGNGHAAWIVRPEIAGADPAAVRPAEVWTVRNGAAVPVTRLAHVDTSGVEALEVGTEAGGAPVAVVTTRRPDAMRDLRLVRLDTGAVRSVSTTRGGLAIGGVGLDAGRYYYTSHVKRPGARNTSSLWRATLTGTSIGRPAKLRTSRRGETWGSVLADRNRVAVGTARRVTSEGAPGVLTEYAFGTPRGTWNRAGQVLVQEGGIRLVVAAGFTQDRAALVTVQGEESRPETLATRTPIAGGSVATVRLGGSLFDATGRLAYDPAAGSFLGAGSGATAATTVLGYTGKAF